MSHNENGVLSNILQVNNRLAQIISCVVEERQHRRSNEFRTIFDQRFRVDTFEQHLKASYCYANIGTESGQPMSQ